MVDSAKEPKYRSPVEAYTDINKAGMQVKAGDIIGYADNTGLSTGNHLHFGLKPVAMNEFNGSFYNAAQENGFNGAVNPVPYFNGRYASDLKNFVFYTDMGKYDENEDVKQLQKKLRKLGYFNFPTDTGYYGEITRQAVYKFQLDHVKLTPWEYFITQGWKCGPKTRLSLNNINI